MKKGFSLTKASTLIGSPIENNKKAFGACVDSRQLKEGDLFFACSGGKCDGHDFLFEASQKKASAAVVSDGYTGQNFGLPFIRVASPEKALQMLAKKTLESYPARVIAITGSAGKTTTKGFLAQLLSSKYRVAATPGNYNSQLGLPLTILNHIAGNEEMIVLEMGMTKAGHITSLVEIAPPDIAVLTGVSLAHAENFDNLEGIIAAKAEIFSNPQTKLGIVDHRVRNFAPIVSNSLHAQLLSFTCNDFGADYAGVTTTDGFELFSHNHSIAKFESLPFLGKHNFHNFIAAALAANQCGVEWSILCEAAKSLVLPPMRLQIEERQGVTIVNDAYNALPIAVKAALDSLPMPKMGGKKIAVLSEMRELGSFSEQCHREIGEHALPLIDVLICIGCGCAPMHAIWAEAGRSVFWINDLAEVAAYLSDVVNPGDVLLFKGSRVSGLSALADSFTLA